MLNLKTSQSLILAILLILFFSISSFSGVVRSVPELPLQLKNVTPDEIAVPITLAEVHYPKSQANIKPRIETVVWVRAFVNKSGEVEKAIIACSDVPSKEFEIAALSATFASEFRPGERRGKPAFKWFYHPVEFTKKMAKKLRQKARLAKENPSAFSEPSSIIFASSKEGSPYPKPDEFVPVEVMPELIDMKTPRYPSQVNAAKIEGTVWIKALVDESGDVKMAFTAKTSGNPFLDRAALDASVKNKFTAALRDGQPVSNWVTYKVEFKLD